MLKFGEKSLLALVQPPANLPPRFCKFEHASARIDKSESFQSWPTTCHPQFHQFEHASVRISFPLFSNHPPLRICKFEHACVLEFAEPRLPNPAQPPATLACLNWQNQASPLLSTVLSSCTLELAEPSVPVLSQPPTILGSANSSLSPRCLDWQNLFRSCLATTCYPLLACLDCQNQDSPLLSTTYQASSHHPLFRQVEPPRTCQTIHHP